MARQLQITIEESAEALEKQLKHVRTASQKERLQMLWRLKTEQVTQHQQLATRLGRVPSSITRWLQKYRQGGLSQLLEIKTAPGQTRQFIPEAYSGLQKRLASETGFNGYGEIVSWLKTEYELKINYATVYYWVHYRLKAKLKVPRPRSAKQDQVAVEQFKKILPPPC